MPIVSIYNGTAFSYCPIVVYNKARLFRLVIYSGRVSPTVCFAIITSFSAIPMALSNSPELKYLNTLSFNSFRVCEDERKEIENKRMNVMERFIMKLWLLLFLKVHNPGEKLYQIKRIRNEKRRNHCASLSFSNSLFSLLKIPRSPGSLEKRSRPGYSSYR